MLCANLDWLIPHWYQLPCLITAPAIPLVFAKTKSSASVNRHHVCAHVARARLAKDQRVWTQWAVLFVSASCLVRTRSERAKDWKGPGKTCKTSWHLGILVLNASMEAFHTCWCMRLLACTFSLAVCCQLARYDFLTPCKYVSGHFHGSPCITGALVVLVCSRIMGMSCHSAGTQSNLVCVPIWVAACLAWHDDVQPCLVLYPACIAGGACGARPKCNTPRRLYLVVLHLGEYHATHAFVGEACS